MAHTLKTRLLVSRAAALCFAAAIFLGAVFFWRDSEHTLSIAGQTFRVNVAETAEDITRGLGGRARLAPDEGMLFRMPQEERYEFWMKDMRFAIDIVWVDAEGVITEITRNVSPDSYPTTFRSQLPAHMILEVSAGVAKPSWVGSTIILEP